MIERQLRQGLHGRQPQPFALHGQLVRGHERTVHDGHGPAARVARRTAESGQLLQIRAGDARLLAQHTVGAGLGIGVLIGMNMATRQGPDPGERRTLALDQRQVQRLVHQG